LDLSQELDLQIRFLRTVFFRYWIGFLRTLDWFSFGILDRVSQSVNNTNLLGGKLLCNRTFALYFFMEFTVRRVRKVKYPLYLHGKYLSIITILNVNNDLLIYKMGNSIRYRCVPVY